MLFTALHLCYKNNGLHDLGLIYELKEKMINFWQALATPGSALCTPGSAHIRS